MAAADSVWRLWPTHLNSTAQAPSAISADGGDELAARGPDRAEVTLELVLHSAAREELGHVASDLERRLDAVPRDLHLARRVEEPSVFEEHDYTASDFDVGRR